MTIQKIDAHQHFWKYTPVRDSWITEDMKTIQRDFLPQDLKPLLDRNGFAGCVAVQSDQSDEENEFHCQLADEFDFIKGIVGWVDLRAPDIGDRLERFRGYRKLKGFRHVLQGEAQRDLMLTPAFKNGISLLHNYGFTYDVLIYRDQLRFIPEFVSVFPEQAFVIDHLAKPDIKGSSLDAWKKDIVAVAQFENVSCKLSGMVTEADWQAWKKEDFRPFLDVVVEAFGPNRIFFGSDWPVCLVAASYDEVVNILADYFSSFTEDEQKKVFAENAIRFYHL